MAALQFKNPQGSDPGQMLKWAQDLIGSMRQGLGAFGGSGPNHSSGVVPDPGATAGASRYLREDGTWAVVPLPYNPFGCL